MYFNVFHFIVILSIKMVNLALTLLFRTFINPFVTFFFNWYFLALPNTVYNNEDSPVGGSDHWLES